MEVSVVTRITIDAPPSEVFRYLTDLKLHYLWNPQLRKVSPLIMLSKGATYRSESTVLGVNLHGHIKVTRFTKDRELALNNEQGQVHYRVNFILQAVDRRTQVICKTTAITHNGYFAFAKPVLKLIARRELQSDLQGLKLAVEHHLT